MIWFQRTNPDTAHTAWHCLNSDEQDGWATKCDPGAIWHKDSTFRMQYEPPIDERCRACQRVIDGKEAA